MYLIAAAIEDEIRDLIPTEKENLIITGMGKLNAAFSLAEAFRIHGDAISGVVNLGTTGSQSFEPESLVEVSRCYQRDTTFFSSYIDLKKITKLPSAICGTGDRVDPFIEKDPWNIVDMELFALAEFCAKKSIPLVSIKYVTDRNEKNVYKEWKKQLPKANQSLSHFWMTQKQQILSELCRK